MNRLRAYATEGIVLRRDDYGEADRLVTLLTPGHGKLRALAKGARRLTSRKGTSSCSPAPACCWRADGRST